jgi:murein L,D-transpeptidase YcbB/YkuD
VAGLLVAVAVLVALILSDPGAAGDDKPVAAPPAAPAAKETAPTAADRRAAAREHARAQIGALGDRLLGPGATGPDVKALQKLIGVPQTGAYDDATAAAVSNFQAAKGLHVDGNAGDQTKRLLARSAR